jgi:hypothetical protein
MNRTAPGLVVLVVVGAIAVAWSWVRLNDCRSQAASALSEYRTCQNLIHRIRLAGQRVPSRMIAAQDFQSGKRLLEVLQMHHIPLEGEPFATELPGRRLGETPFLLTDVSIPRARMTMAQLAELLEVLDEGDDPLFASSVSLEAVTGAAAVDEEVWRTSLQIFTVQRASDWP